MSDLQSHSRDEEQRYHDQTHCPSCGRFSGTFSRCPYCLAQTKKRLSIQAFKVMAVLTSTVGLLLLLFFARKIETPLVNIDKLGPLSNFAHVRIIAPVTRSFGLHPEWGSLAFILEQPRDGQQPASIRVSAYAKVAAEIGKAQIIPQEGDLVSVEGQVRFTKDSPSLLINAPEHLKILKKAADMPKNDEPREISEVMPPEKITRDMLGSIVTIRGQVTSLKVFPSGISFSIAKVDGGTFSVWQPAKFDSGDPAKTPKQNDIISAKGKVQDYKGSLQIEIVEDSAITLLEKSEEQSSD